MNATAPVAGVVLAAGRSQRLPGAVPKQLLELGGVPQVCRVVRSALASRLAEVVVVLGHRAEAVGEALTGFAVRRVLNPDFEDGQSTSVRAGLKGLGPDVAAAMFLPADQPLLRPATLDRSIAAWEATGGPIVAPVHRGGWRSPVLFDRSLFGELETLSGDAGGRRLLPRYRASIVAVEVADRWQLEDVDTLQDLRRLEERTEERRDERAG